MLLTGDARGDLILDSLNDANLLTNGKHPVDIFKVPHHGSTRNNAPKLFAAVPAKHYVISANGKYGNPDNPMIDDLFEARPNGPYDIWLTNDVTHAVKRIKDNKPAEVTLQVRDAAELSVKVELGQKITW